MIPLQTLAGHPVTHIVFSPDGGTVAVAQPHYGVTLLERTTGHTLGVCALPRRDVLTGLTFCGEGRFLAAASAKGVEVFDAATGAPVAKSFRPVCKGLRLAERNGELIVGGHLGVVRVVWRPDVTADDGFDSDPIASGPKVIDGLSPDGRFTFVVESLGFHKLFDLTAGRAAWVYRPAGPLIPKFVFSFCPLGRRFAINDGHTLDVYDTAELEDDGADQYADTPLVQRAGSADQATAVAPMPHVALRPTFALETGKPSVGDWYPPFALRPDGRGLLVKRPRNRIQLWDAPTGSLVNEWSWRFEWVTCVAVSNDGLTAVAGGRFGRVLLWDLD